MIHFSIDDTINIFKNLTLGEYSSCFEEPTLLFFKRLNEKYGLKVSLYCFFEEDSGFNLSEVTDKFKEEFRANSKWLRFGFHALNRKSDYSSENTGKFIYDAELVYHNLERITGKESLTYDVRLGFAKGNECCIREFRKKYPFFNVLYGVDDERVEYYLSSEENNILLTKGYIYEYRVGICIKLSELRLEKQKDLKEYLKTMPLRDYYAFFTHEVYLSEERIKENIIELCKYADEFII